VKRPKKSKVTTNCHSTVVPIAVDTSPAAIGNQPERCKTMNFSDETQALIAQAEELRDAAVAARGHAADDAAAAAAAAATSKESEAARVNAFADAAAAKTAAIQAIEKELGIPPVPPPAPPAAPASMVRGLQKR
jgi:hypothetical protein